MKRLSMTELEKGISVEREHFKDDKLRKDVESGKPDKDLEKDIAQDHLEESDQYYDKLEQMEKSFKEEQSSLSMRFNKMADISQESILVNDMKYLLFNIVKQLDKIPVTDVENNIIIKPIKDRAKDNIKDNMTKFHLLFSQCFGQEL